MSSKLKRAAFRALYRTKGGLRPEHPDSYATHQPILIGIARLRAVKNVLELGSGPFSTTMFLNREAFPELQSLVSYEDVPAWRDKVMEAVGEDERLDLRLVDAVHESAGDASRGPYDLIFIDNSARMKLRESTMRAVGRAQPLQTAVVIHDFEWKPYRQAIKETFENVVIFDTFTPQTGVAWNGFALDRSAVEDLRGQIEARRELDVTDSTAWGRALSKA